MSKYSVGASYNTHSGYLTGADDIQGAADKAKWAREYYEPMYPGTVVIDVRVACEHCSGVGRVAKGRKNVRFPKYTDCPECEGSAFLPVPAVA